MNRYLEGAEPADFDDPNNINRGLGRIIWAHAATDSRGVYHPEGWVLPGGARTSVHARAAAAAVRIHDITFDKR